MIFWHRGYGGYPVLSANGVDVVGQSADLHGGQQTS
jgi:hypothetical protein